MRTGILLVVSGPSGSGKTTLCRRLADEGETAYSISCTTRPARPGERDGHDYQFLEKAEFEARVQAGGTPVEVELERERGLELEVRLAAGQEPWPEELFVLLLEADLCDQVERGSNGWQVGQGLRGLNVVESRRIRPDSEGRASARALRPGRCRFVSFPDTIAIEPSEILVTGAETEPVELRWTPR